MARPGRGPSERFETFVAVARRTHWTLPGPQRRIIWQGLQAARAAEARRPTGGFAETIETVWRRVSSPRTLFLALAFGTVVAAGVHLIAGRAPAGPWHHELQLGGDGEEATMALGQVQGPGDLTFSDGTQIKVDPLAQVVVDSVSAVGADIRVVRGALDAHVRPKSRAHWTFVAGPFRVEVKGTSFKLQWQPGADRLSLNMWSGVVVVRGGQLREAITVAAGESVLLAGSADAPLPAAEGDGESGPSSGGGVPTAPIVGTEGPGPALAPVPEEEIPEPPQRHTTSRRGGRDAAGARTSWPALLARGAFPEIVERARRRGISSLLSRGSEADIAAFADAARYTREDRLARRGLLALRARFPNSERAKSGAFFLGRLGESSEPQVDKALWWYDRYLAEAPHGAYAEGAMAREMVLLRQHRLRARAKAVAQRYLTQYPDGTYCDLAIRLGGSEVR